MNYSEIKKILEKKFSDAKIEETADIDWIIAEITGKSRSFLPFIKEFSEIELEKINFAIEKRLNHIPLGLIFGKTNFFGRDFFVSNDTLIPRIDTEILVEEVINCINLLKLENNKNINNSITVLDIGTGSGAIAITIEKETNSLVCAVDISKKALEIAIKNGQNLNSKVEFFYSNLFSEIQNRKFDIIISNPPYIKSDIISSLEPEVKDNEPILALDGGTDGLYFYKKIIRQSKYFLNNEGMLFFEIGFDQGKEVENLLNVDYENIKIVKDYSNNDRVVYGKLRRNL